MVPDEYINKWKLLETVGVGFLSMVAKRETKAAYERMTIEKMK